MDDVNIITKLALAVFVFLCYICTSIRFYDLYLSIDVLVLLMFNGIKFKITFAFIFFTITFSLISALFMIFMVKVLIYCLN